MKYPKTYQYAERKRLLEIFKAKVVCVVQSREKGMSFQEIADACNVSDRQTAFKIYEANKKDHEIRIMSRKL